jgi:hypothetical protein
LPADRRAVARSDDATGVFGGGPAIIGHRGLGRGVVSGHREDTLGSFGQDPCTGVVDASAAARTLSLVQGCGRQLMVWCPATGPARMLVAAGADAVVVAEVPQAIGALAMTA